MTFKQILGATAAALGALQVGIINLPLPDAEKSLIGLIVTVVAVFLAGLLKPPAE